VLNALLQERPRAEIRVWCDSSFTVHTKSTMQQLPKEVRVDTILSGKFRRYHTLAIWKQLFMFQTIVIPNIIDGAKIVAGTAQALMKLVIWRPNVIFCKGGFVCLPVGVAALILRIPIVLHDSDVHAGLTNKILSKWARKIATGATLDNYDYPVDRSMYVGIPISLSYKKHSIKRQNACKDALGFSADRPLVVVTGGGLGARAINTLIMEIANKLLKDTNLILIAGSNDYKKLQQNNVYQEHADSMRIYDFVGPEMVDILTAADVVVARAGATTLLELASLAKPTIIIPNPYLTGNHQVKNAAAYDQTGAALVLDEKRLVDDPEKLYSSVLGLLKNEKQKQMLSLAIHRLAKPNAARDVAHMILSVAKPKRKTDLR
jgi:UDP-N-acetylglucosamine--N-acetylmuramyl-(pentapeptide) pyrophosphoryl-undecaprenol N-acetylglucosamine transferase